MNKEPGIWLWLVVAIIGVVAGYGLAHIGGGTDTRDLQMKVTQAQAMNDKCTADRTDCANRVATADQKTRDAQLNSHSGAADLRLLINAIQRQHVDLAATATRNGFDGDPAFDASAKALLKNSDELAGAVGSVYGPDAQKQFLAIWNSHITYFVDYTVAAKKGDKKGMDDAVQNLIGYEDAIADFFSTANPNLPKQAVHDLVAEHVTLLKAAVDAHAAGNYALSFQKQGEAYSQIGTIADAISGAIVKQKPELFVK